MQTGAPSAVKGVREGLTKGRGSDGKPSQTGRCPNAVATHHQFPGRLVVVVPVATCGHECLIAIQFVPKRKLRSGNNLEKQEIERSSRTQNELRLVYGIKEHWNIQGYEIQIHFNNK